MFDVSHMLAVNIKSENVRGFLRQLVANNVDKLTQPGKALYTCMLNPEGRVIDDLIIYFLSESWFRMVVNAGTAEKDLTITSNCIIESAHLESILCRIKRNTFTVP